jgi:hypothetical protein
MKHLPQVYLTRRVYRQILDTQQELIGLYKSGLQGIPCKVPIAVSPRHAPRQDEIVSLKAECKNAILLPDP